MGLLLQLLASTVAAACVSDAECDDGDPCSGPEVCVSGSCADAFTLPFFPVSGGHDAYGAPIISVMDHSGSFYGRCCDTEIVAFTGERAQRGEQVELCPVEPVFPGCLLNDFCLCGYRQPEGAAWVVNGNYQGALFDPTYLSYAGHAGYDFRYAAATPLVATRDGQLCKAQEDPVNGHFLAASAWDRFHTFYVDHGVHGGVGYASWYLHADDLDGSAVDGGLLQELETGACAPVTAGQTVGRVGAFGTFAPHLHFEVRRYPPAEGPESFAAKVIDPYGWAGSGADPWSDPLENPQAESNPTPLWVGCGNGRLDCGEQCDDGNRHDGDCCSASCTLEPAGTACTASGGICALEQCDGAGTCVDVAAPRLDCRTPTRPLASRLDVTRRGGDGDALAWQWRRGAATSVAEFGAPGVADGYRLCAFDLSASPPQVVLAIEIPAGGVCPGGPSGRPCWKDKGSPANPRGYVYADAARTPDGITRLDLTAGGEGKARFSLRGSGSQLSLPALPLPLPLHVQLEAGSGACWSARFAASTTARNDADRFSSRNE